MIIALSAMIVLTLMACVDTLESSQGQEELATENETDSEEVTEMQEGSDSSSVVKNDDTPKEEREEENVMYVHIGNRAFTMTLVENAATEALLELLEEEPITINMQDYGGFEKVGSLGTNLPTSDVQISSDYGDVILYQGNQIAIFYDSNAWSYTRIGRINDVIQEDLIEVLGSGDVTVTLSLSQ